jgi:hypothetical protein
MHSSLCSHPFCSLCVSNLFPAEFQRKFASQSTLVRSILYSSHYRTPIYSPPYRVPPSLASADSSALFLDNPSSLDSTLYSLCAKRIPSFTRLSLVVVRSALLSPSSRKLVQVQYSCCQSIVNPNTIRFATDVVRSLGGRCNRSKAA